MLSRTCLTKPGGIRLTAKGFNRGLLLIRANQGYELMVHAVVGGTLQRGEPEGHSCGHPADEPGLHGPMPRGRSREVPFHLAKQDEGEQRDRT